MLTEKQYKLLMYIYKVTKETGCAPSFNEMRDAIGLKSKSGIHALLTALEEREFIKRLPHKARALEVLRLPKLKPSSIVEEEKKIKAALASAAAQVPLCGKICAGLPVFDKKDEVLMIAVPLDMVDKGAYYALIAGDDSMTSAGILDGDIAIIKKTNTANVNSIVVAITNDREVVLKILDRADKKVHITAYNRIYQTRVLSAENMKIKGVVCGIIRYYH